MAVFVENHPGAVAALRSNLCITGLAEQAKIIAVDAWAALEQLNSCGISFDVAMADPPYAFDRWDELLARTPADLVVIQSDRQIEVGSDWEVCRCKRYGRTVVMFVALRRRLRDTTAQAP